MRESIVITSINYPTKAVKEFAKIKDLQLFVVADKKTPQNWNCTEVKLISVKDQDESEFRLPNLLPYNHYARKMIGYLEAIKSGTEYIIDTDDDNIPYESFHFPDFEDVYDCVVKNQGFVNIYKFFTEMKIWPRGLPLDLINKNTLPDTIKSTKKIKIGIWQGLADNDPDVDAIYRLTSDKPCTFGKRQPIVLEEGTISPFNTQNTKIRKELFPLLYLPSTVTFRYTDILRGLIAQPIMWLYGYHLGFSEATVFQERNPHDYFKDFISEIPMFLTGEKVVKIVQSIVKPQLSIEDNIFNSYQMLLKEQIVNNSEILCLEAWLNDLSNISC